MKIMKNCVIILVILSILAGCKDSGRMAELDRIASMVNNDPHAALDMLDSIDTSELRGESLHYFDFLSIKAKDKCYIVHTSDSLIHSVIEYYESDPGIMLPEVYYYGGRVYFDLGDAPQALNYFQKSLDIVGPDDLELKGRIVSQMGKIYASQYLFSHAINKVKESINIDIQLSDTFGLVYDNSMMADIYSAVDNLDSANNYYSKAFALSKSLSKGDEAVMQANLAYNYFLKNDIEKALELADFGLLSTIPENAKPMVLSKYLSIYKFYDDDIVEYLISELWNYGDNVEIRSIIYGALVELDLKKQNVDSIYSHIALYKIATDSLNSLISQEAINYQNSYFNYSIRERDNIQLLKDKHEKEIEIFTIISICILLCLVLMYFINANKQKKLKLRLAISKLNQLDKEYCEVKKQLNSTAELKEELLSKIRRRVDALDENGGPQLPQELIESDVYKDLCIISEDETRIISEEKWIDVVRLTDSVFPQFRANLMILLGTVSDQEYRICVLAKLGFTPTSISKLTFRTKGAVSNCRMRMSQRAFGEKKGATYWDKVVRGL